MSSRKNELEEALVFAEDLISNFFRGFETKNIPSSGKRNGHYITRHYNEDIFRVVCYYSMVMNKPFYRANYFPKGYNAMDFLNYCGKVVSYALRDFQSGIGEALDEAICSIASCLKEFISSGEFQKHGGWFELKDLCSKLYQWNVFCSVVCIGNKYGDFVKKGENTFTGPQTAA